MDLEQAKAECQRWFDYLQRQKDKCAAIQKIAADRRTGAIDETEGRRQLQRIDAGVTVYDGANLQKAIAVLLKNLKESPTA